MSIKALSDFTFYGRYSATKNNNKKETWRESTVRPFDMHRIKYADKILEFPKLLDEIAFAELQQQKKRVLGSQRALQFSIEPILKHNFKIFNCAATHVDRTDVFSEIMYVLLCGCGVGFSVQKQHIEQLPALFLPTRDNTYVYTVEDSIEGWSDAIRALISSYFDESSNLFGKTVYFDYRKIRPKGSLIAGRFLAPGSEGLEASLEKIRKLLNGQPNGSKIRPIVAYDTIMHLSDAVLSGGVRRSATLCLFSFDDDEMTRAKTGNWYRDNPQRARSNNSAGLLKSVITRDEFANLIQSTKEYGEPGFIWLDDLDICYNPCCISGETNIMTDKGLFTAKSLVGKKFNAVVDNKSYPSTDIGFFENGVKSVYILRTVSGHEVKLTDDHRVLTQTRGWVQTKDLTEDDYLTFGQPNVSNAVPRFESLTYAGEETVYDCTIPDIECFSGNGIVLHNCEIGLYPKTLDGRSGFEACNLTEINGKFCDTEENFYQACRASAIIGTLQAGYTDFKYLSSASKEICDREALLGCSITGIMDNPSILLNPEIQRNGAVLIRETNVRIAEMIGINPCARATTVKPAGSTSCLLSTGSGIHPHHAKKYIRRVQVNNTEEIASIFKKYNPTAVEPSAWSANNTDSVISFLCEVSAGSITKNQLDAISMLENVKLTQQNWVEYGTNRDANIIPAIRHSVSNTVVVKPEEWDSVEDFIYDNRQFFAGISLLPASGDLDYTQAPFSAILTPNELVKEYGDACVFASGLIVDGLAAFNNDLWNACDIAIGIVNNITLTDLQSDWIRRANQFAERYFDNDIKKMTYCLKHVSLWKTWCDLTREYKDIVWSDINWNSDAYQNANELSAQTCNGNNCEVNII